LQRNCIKFCILLLAVSVHKFAICQLQKKGSSATEDAYSFLQGNKNLIAINDSIFLRLGNCKNNGVYLFESLSRINNAPVYYQPKENLIQIHGNILYNFNYRSYIDTPFAQTDLMQHLVQSNFNILIDKKYPLRITITSRSSNSPYFRNTLDVNFNINRNQVLENIRASLKSDLNAMANAVRSNLNSVTYGGDMPSLKLPEFEWKQLIQADKLQALQQKHTVDTRAINKLQDWLNSPARAQELIEERERKYRLPDTTSRFQFKGEVDSLFKVNEISDRESTKGFLTALQNKLDKQVTAKKQSQFAPPSAKDKIDAATKKMEEMRSKINRETAAIKKEQKKIADSINAIRNEINTLVSTAQLYEFMQKHKIDKSKLTKTQRVFLAINQLGIGRTWVDYSELTVKNISLAGVNVEATPSRYYIAFAAGKVNYRFRDFIYKNNQSNLPNQSVALIRAGLGQKTKNNIIFTFYDGKKAVLNSGVAPTFNNVQHVLGYAVESRLAIDANNYLVAEFAKSSYYDNPAQQPSTRTLQGKAFNFKENSNQAFSIKLFSNYPKTNTKVNGYYKKLGEHFQSFTLYPFGINQEAWQVKLNQSFLKRKVAIEASVRKNDFVSPIAAPSFNNQTVFKSFQASVRVPKYPFVTVGYYPSSQITVSNNNILVESQYNTLNAMMSHTYVLKNGVSMNTNAVFTKFYNTGSDTGFIYFNASSYSINQSIFLDKFQLLTGINYTNQSQLQLFTFEQGLQYQLKNTISIIGGIKWTKENTTRNLFGAKAGMNIQLKKIGVLQMNYEKTYLPSFSRMLIPVDMGQINFYREF
jgi:hypothetical protein